jgi:hypothetical protein
MKERNQHSFFFFLILVPYRNSTIYLQIPMVQNEISRYSYQYNKRFSVRPNELILNFKEPPETRRLRKHLPIDLPTRFIM